MSQLYVDEAGTKLRVHENRLQICYPDTNVKEIPVEAVDGITILGNAQLTTQCMQLCLKRGISVSFFSKGGSYFGRLQSSGHVNTERQRFQCSLYGTVFSIDLAKQITRSKIHNQKVILSRYGKSREIDVYDPVSKMERCREKIKNSISIDEINGYEGYAARIYFEGLATVIEPDFAFRGRSRRPPQDEFNSLISLGYSILMNTLYESIENKGLNPYFGFMHQDKEKHPTLASDLMEEWRAPLVDSTAMSLINGHELRKEHFCLDHENGGCFLTKDGLKIFLIKLEKKMQEKIKYLKYVTYPVSFRQAIRLQIEQLVFAMQEQNANKYQPLEIR